MFYVYVLFQENTVVYVGLTTNLNSRINSHKSSKVFDSVDYYELSSNDQMRSLETYLIHLYNPKYNKTFGKGLVNPTTRRKYEGGYFKSKTYDLSGRVVRYASTRSIYSDYITDDSCVVCMFINTKDYTDTLILKVYDTRTQFVEVRGTLFTMAGVVELQDGFSKTSTEWLSDEDITTINMKKSEYCHPNGCWQVGTRKNFYKFID